ncbi:MFS transporter [Paracraurococcus lichenis]|uniref:MFS transporter n=1 Tax=Paracraurococcus lichenis TaxID=3064888 RepID=A0ABT9E419_9PROT|nr:MFS transporter [Paracraurococcus sp. LOR1-02]MDO9710908.1 MFS transporter [Paracraurococcus sp. LOR1-02]
MYARLRWFIIALLFLGGAISYLDRAALSIAAPLVARDLGLDPARLGIVFSSFFFGYALFCFVGGWAADRIGPKNVFTLAMTVWSVFCGLTAAATGLVSLLLIRVVFGMGEGPFSSTANKLVSNWFPREEQASAVGMANAGQPLGAALAGPVVGFIAVSFGWRISFVVIAAVGLLWVVAWMLLATDRPDQHRWLDMAARARAVQERTRRAAAPALPLGTYLRRPAILATGFAFFGYAYILYFFLSWFPTYLTMSQGLSVQRMGAVNAIPWLVGFVGLASSGFVCDAIFRRRGDALFARKLVLVGSLLVAAVCVALAGIVRGVVPVVALMAVSVFFMYLTASTYWAIILDTVPEARVGGVSGFVHLIANLAGIVAPSVTGFLVEWSGSFGSAFVVTGGIAVAGALAVAVFVREPAPAAGAAMARAPV